MRPDRRAYILVATWGLLYGGLIALDVLWGRGVIDSSVGPVVDISYYRYRTQGILDGLWLYRDIPCESPPLIVYLMIPAQLANGGNLAYQIWFSIFVLLTSLTIYWGLRRFDDKRAFFAAFMFIWVPVGAVETVGGIQDESIMIWLFVLSIVLAALSRWRQSVFVMAVGAWTKVINVFLYPFIWHEVKDRHERRKHLGVIAAVSLFVAIPYLIVCPIDFLKFPLYYFFSSPDVGPTGGTSFWDFLEMGGLVLPSWLFLILTISTLVGAYLFAFQRRMTLLEGMLVVLTAFVIVYSRSAAGYFMLPISLLLIWGAEDRLISTLCMLLYVPLIASAFFSDSTPSGVPYFDVTWGWIAGALLQLTTLIMLFCATRLALKKKNFVDRAIARRSAGGGVS